MDDKQVRQFIHDELKIDVKYYYSNAFYFIEVISQYKYLQAHWKAAIEIFKDFASRHEIITKVPEKRKIEMLASIALIIKNTYSH